MFIILPVGMNYETKRAPVVTFALMGANVLVYLISLGFVLNKGDEAQMWIYEHLWLIPAYSTWYTYVSSMFVHAGLLHLVGNMFYLFLFGCCVEDIIGRWRFLAVYLLGGLLAQVAYIGLIPQHFASEIPMGGASGAISTCMGAYLLLRADVDIDFRYFGLFFFRFFSGEFSLPAWIVISFWFLKDLFFAGLALYLNHEGGGVAFGAHIGGFVAGLAMTGLLKLFPQKESQPKRQPIRVQPGKAVRAIAPGSTESRVEAPTIYLYDGTAQSGPFDLFQIQHMLSQGTVTDEALYWSAGMTEWRNVSDLSEGASR